MTLSVCCITYQHEEFIGRALESFVSQQTNFDFEIIICDDCSKDATREICEKFKNKYPDKIKLHLNESNVGMMRNFIQALKMCTGKYIALCEGDDYWTSSNKLQKQVDFLETNPEYVLCFHNALVINERVKPTEEHPLISSLDKTSFETPDIITQWFIPTASIVFKKQALKFPDWFENAEIGDIPLLLIVSLAGSFKYINEIMSVWHLHPGGISGKFTDYKKAIAMTFIYQSFNIYTNFRYNEKIIQEIKYEWHRYVINELLEKKEKEILDLVHARSLKERILNLTQRFFKSYRIKLFQKKRYSNSN